MNEQGLSQRLSEAGLRRTKARLGMLSVLYDSKEPMSAEQIFMALEKECKQRCNLCTVYRFLRVMRAKGIVYLLANKDGSDLYHLPDKAEVVNRLICRSCERFIPIPARQVREMKAFAIQAGFGGGGFQVHAYSLCECCKTDRRREEGGNIAASPG